MQKETEIKLRVSRATLEALQEHPLLKKRNKSGWERRELYNQYYDTPGRELARAKVALRMRRDGEQYIQTLKSRGQSVAGLSERNEWDWYLEKNKLDLKKLDDKCWPAALKDLDKKQLKPIFSTDFVRQRAEIAWGRGKARVVVEAALDLGKVVAGDNQEEICELELELRQGDAAALLELAAELAADLPLMPCDISKAERGYRLFDPNSYEVDPRPRNCWRKPRWTVPSPPSPGTCSAAASDWPNSIASTATGACWRTGCNTCRTCVPCSAASARRCHAPAAASCAKRWTLSSPTGRRASSAAVTTRCYASRRRNCSAANSTRPAGACSP